MNPLIGKRVRIAHHRENDQHLHGMKGTVVDFKDGEYEVNVRGRAEFVRRVEELPPRLRDKPAFQIAVMLAFAVALCAALFLIAWLT